MSVRVCSRVEIIIIFSEIAAETKSTVSVVLIATKFISYCVHAGTVGRVSETVVFLSTAYRVRA